MTLVPGGTRSFARAAVALILMLAPGCGGRAVVESTSAFPAGRGFVEHELSLDGVPQRLWVFVPRDCDGKTAYPAIIFLHGLFEAGKTGTGALSAGLGPVIARDPENWPFIVIFPQSDGTWRGEARQRQVLASLDFASARYAIDPDRVILAGLSYGGLGAWQIGSKHADRFAAVVSVSGLKDLAAAHALRDVPVWAFHSRGDPLVSVEHSRAMLESLQRAGGEGRLTVFPAIDHDCWDRAVAESDLVDWMLDRRRAAHVAVPTN